MLEDKKSWYNPFKYIAGGQALLYGLIAVFLASLIGNYSGIHFPGVIDAKVGWEGSFAGHLGMALIAWLSMTVVTYPMARVLSSTKVRLIDIAGTQALARTPSVFLALLGFFGVVRKVTDAILIRSMEQLEHIMEIQIEPITDPGPVATWEYILAALILLITILLIIWMVVLMYHAYRVSSNLKGSRAGFSFVMAILIAQVVSNACIYFLARSGILQF